MLLSKYMCADFAAQMTPKRFEILHRRWKDKMQESLNNKTVNNEFAKDYLKRLDLLKDAIDTPLTYSFKTNSNKIVPVMNSNKRLSGLMDLESSDNANRPTHRYINNLVKNPKAVDNPEPYGKLAPLAFKHVKNNYSAQDTIGISGLNTKLDNYYQSVSGLPKQSFEDLRQLIRNRQELLPGAVQGKVEQIKNY